jgi:hypothetical protein
MEQDSSKGEKKPHCIEIWKISEIYQTVRWSSFLQNFKYKRIAMVDSNISILLYLNI